MPDLAIRLGSREFDLANLLSAILPDDLESTLFEGGAKLLRNVVISLSVQVAWRAWKDLLIHADLIELLRVYLQRVRSARYANSKKWWTRSARWPPKHDRRGHSARQRTVADVEI